MTANETLIANLETLKADRRKVKALTEMPTPLLDNAILNLSLRVAFASNCRCEPDYCHECYVPSQKEWNTDESER